MLPAFNLNNLSDLVNFILAQASAQGPLPQTFRLAWKAQSLPLQGSSNTSLRTFHVGGPSNLSGFQIQVGDFWVNSDPTSPAYATIKLAVLVYPNLCWHLCTSTQEVFERDTVLAEASAYLAGGSGSSAPANEIEYAPVGVVTGANTFVLPTLPAGPVSMYVNGVVYSEGSGIAVSGVNVTWLGVTLIEAGDDILFRYSPFVPLAPPNPNLEIEYRPTGVVDGQTAFHLPQLPGGPVSSYLNGVVGREDSSFVRVGQDVTWISQVGIEASDDLVFRYAPA